VAASGVMLGILFICLRSSLGRASVPSVACSPSGDRVVGVMGVHEWLLWMGWIMGRFSALKLANKLANRVVESLHTAWIQGCRVIEHFIAGYGRADSGSWVPASPSRCSRVPVGAPESLIGPASDRWALGILGVLDPATFSSITLSSQQPRRDTRITQPTSDLDRPQSISLDPCNTLALAFLPATASAHLTGPIEEPNDLPINRSMPSCTLGPAIPRDRLSVHHAPVPL
jgi:hypothetical protein